MRFYIHTFGCQMNEHDSERMASLLAGMGYKCTKSDAEADLILFNTCTVREHAHHKAISEIGRAIALKRRRPDLIVGVCGCVAQVEKGHLFEIYPELDFVFGPDQIHQLKSQIPNSKSQTNFKFQIPNPKFVATELINDPEEYSRTLVRSYSRTPTRLHERTRARESERTRSREHESTNFVTIMKGCNNKCSFCIVPFVRGSEVSKPENIIIDEIKSLVKHGVKEVTLLGQNVNSYVRTLVRSHSPARARAYERTRVRAHESTDFVNLLRRISEETDILRIRYTSPHPKDLGDDLIEEHAVNTKLCRHIHLPLQAGSDRILRAMKRSYNKKQFLTNVEKLRNRVQGIEITTDIIVGFPGETEEDFLETLDVVKKSAFDGMFAFKYSPRHGTKAAELKDDVLQNVKEERLRRLLELNAAIWKEKTQKLVGTLQEVLVEGVSKKSSVVSRQSGRSLVVSRQSLDAEVTDDQQPTTNDQLTGRTFGNKIVNFAGNLELIGHIVPVVITDAKANSLVGQWNG